MTKTDLQSALAEATQTDKRTAGVFLDTLSNLAYKAIKKNEEFVLPGFGKLVKQKRKARTGFNPKTQQKIKIPAKTVVKFRVACLHFRSSQPNRIMAAPRTGDTKCPRACAVGSGLTLLIVVTFTMLPSFCWCR